MPVQRRGHGHPVNRDCAERVFARLSRRQRSCHHRRPRHDSERGLHSYAGHPVREHSLMPPPERTRPGVRHRWVCLRERLTQ